MLVEITIVSEKFTDDEEETLLGAEKTRLLDLGYKVWSYNERVYASRMQEGYETVVEMWGQEFFRVGKSRKPAMLSVTFTKVCCQSVCGYIGGQSGAVVMVNPNDPIHTSLLSFTVTSSLTHESLAFREVAVRIERNPNDSSMDISAQRIACFMRVLRVCEREFYSKNKIVRFNTRKRIGKAKRHYLLWARREGKDLDVRDLGCLRNLDCQIQKSKETIGKLTNAEGAWQQIVALEKGYMM